jgi:hypothetical protein
MNATIKRGKTRINGFDSDGGKNTLFNQAPNRFITYLRAGRFFYNYLDIISLI